MTIKRASETAPSIEWQEEADVVVLGFGGAGAVAAITAMDAGAEVLILEKQTPQKHTPNTMMSGGGLHMANNIQEAAKYFKAMAFGMGLGLLATPPYYAIAEYPGGPNTEGGLVKNARSQVVDVFGKPIPRLYAAGEIASAWSFLYQAGDNLAECVICGRAAGKNAAMERPWP